MTAVLSPAEQAVMRHTFKATMKRAADIIDRITDADVLEAQATLLASGSTLQQVAKIDRAMLAAAHLRSCSLMGRDGAVDPKELRMELEKRR